MRIVIVNPVWDPAIHGATETLEHFTTLTGWASTVHASGVDSVTVCQRFSEASEVVRDHVRYRFVADGGRAIPRWSSRGSTPLVRAIVEEDPDVVHLNGLVFPELTRSLRAALPEHTSLVVQDHGGFDPAIASTLTRVWLRRGLAAADAALVASPGQADALRQYGIAPPDTLIADVMESGTMLRPTKRDEARRQLRMHGDPALLWVGRLTENKDPMTVLRACASWFEQHPRATLTMVFHAGNLATAVGTFIAETPSLASRVAVIGAVPHHTLAAYYSAADLFVLGSHYEGSGYAAIEALACGAVPVVTRIAPFRALTNDGTIGALWEPGDSRSLVTALAHVVARPMPAQRAAASEWFDRHFSWPTIGQRAVAIYREVMASRDQKRGSVVSEQTRRPASETLQSPR